MKKITFLFLFFCVYLVSAQNDISQIEQDYLKFIPDSPEATAFMEYGNNSVSLYTGTPNISIPIYTISGREYSMPITLSYNASGIRVEQQATWVGLGWNLNAGGVITREVNGLVDDVLGTPHYKKHYQQEVVNLMQTYQGGIVENQEYNVDYVYDYKFDFEREIEEGRMDTRPDKYSFNVNGFSGEFFIDYLNNIGVCTTNSDIKIIPSFTDNSTLVNDNKIIDSFIIIDEFGNAYHFDKVESKTVRSETSDGTRDIYGYNSSWFLTKIISSSKKDVIDFNYSSNTLWDSQVKEFGIASAHSLITPYQPGDNPQVLPDFFTTPGVDFTYQINTFYLQSIELNDKEIVSLETSTLDRKDIPGGVKALEKILIKYDSTILKDFRLSTSYFENTDPNPTSPDYELKRLKLDSFYEVSSNEKRYSFEYIGDGEIPDKKSKSQDYWGFFNNQTNQYLVPKSESVNIPNGSFGGDRNTNSDVNIVGRGTLNKIIYPTKGYSIFEYDIHKTPQETIAFGKKTNLLLDYIGGYNGNEDPYNVGGGCFQPIRYPFGETFMFTLSETQDVRFDITVENNPNGDDPDSRGPMEFFAVYPVGYNGTSGPIYEFCDLYQNSNIPLSQLNPQGSYTVNLAAGDYYGVFLSNDNRNISSIDLFTNKLEVPLVGGLRVKKISDFDSDDTYLKSKNYFYNDISQYDFSNYSTYMDDYTSSAVVHMEPRYTELLKRSFAGILGCPSQGGHVSSGGTLRTYFYEKRNAQNVSTPKSNHIAYSSVSVVNVDDAENIKDVIVRNYYNESNPDSYFFYNRFSSEQLNGSLLNEFTYNKDGDILSSKEVAYSNFLNQTFNYPLDIFFKSNHLNQGVSYVVQQNNHQNILKEKYIIYPPSIASIPCNGTLTLVLGLTSPTTDPSDPAHVESFSNFKIGDWYKNTMTASQAGFIITKMDSVVNKQYFYQNSTASIVETKTKYYYDNPQHYQLTETITTTSETNRSIINKTKYPQDMPSGEPFMTDLIAANRIAEPIQQESYETTGLGNNILLNTIVTKYFNSPNSNLILPERIQIAKGNDLPEDRVIYHKYDSYGNPQEVSQADGTRIAYIWGYSGEYPVAKIENKAYDAIPVSLRNAIVSASINGTETQLQTALNNLRNDSSMNDAMVTTITYKPLIGVSTMTDPRGYTMSYEYDDLNRLKYVRDADGNIVSKNQYNYKN